MQSTLEAAPTKPIERVLGSYSSGRSGVLVVVLGGLHGNEPAGIHAARRVLATLEREQPEMRGALLALAGNTAALAQGQRFIDRDLNRMWSEDDVRIAREAGGDDCRERGEQRALLAEIEPRLAQSWSQVLFLDLHSTSAEGPPFCLVGDTLQNRRIALRLKLPVILGLEENVEGTLLGHYGEQGHVAIGVEGGRHDDPRTIDHHESVLWTVLVTAGLLVEADLPEYARHRARLETAGAGPPAVLELLHRHAVEPGDGFRMEPGFVNFQPVEHGELRAGADGGQRIEAPRAGVLLMPLYQGQGQDGFFLGRRVRPFWLHLSTLLRRLRLGTRLQPAAGRAPRGRPPRRARGRPPRRALPLARALPPVRLPQGASRGRARLLHAQGGAAEAMSPMCLMSPMNPRRLAAASLAAALTIACSSASDGLRVLVPTVERAPETATAGFDHSHARWTALLREHVRPDGIDYRGFGKDIPAFDRYLAELQAVDRPELEGWTREQRFAFWINVYNAHVVRLIVDHYPVASIKDLGGTVFGRIWDKKIVPLPDLDPEGKGANLSLGTIEHEILRPRFKDARVHAAINCASVSCPPLLPEAFVAERLDAQLDAVMHAFVADPTRNRLDREGHTIHLSKIFDWFASDFERDAESVRAYVTKYAPADPKWIAGAKVKYRDYSWKLNDAAEK